jgi:hypothetical protein
MYRLTATVGVAPVKALGVVAAAAALGWGTTLVVASPSAHADCGPQVGRTPNDEWAPCPGQPMMTNGHVNAPMCQVESHVEPQSYSNIYHQWMPCPAHDPILSCTGVPGPCGAPLAGPRKPPAPDPYRIAPPPGGFQTPAQMEKEDCDKLQNDVHVLDQKDPTGLGVDAAELATDVPVGLSVIAALASCGTTDVQFNVGEIAGTLVKAAVPH